jgi:hypothetical protein
MNAEDLRLAPAGASDAACAVCLHMTFNRIVSGDGFVPICSGSCLQAWPRVAALMRIARAAKAFRDWDAVGALVLGDEPHAEDAQNDLRELDAALDCYCFALKEDDRG